MSETEKGLLIIGGVAIAIFALTRHDSVQYPQGNVYPGATQQINQDQVALNTIANLGASLIPSGPQLGQIFGSASGGNFGGAGATGDW